MLEVEQEAMVKKAKILDAQQKVLEAQAAYKKACEDAGRGMGGEPQHPTLPSRFEIDITV